MTGKLRRNPREHPMTTELRARVSKSDTIPFMPWIADVWAVNDGRLTHCDTRVAASHPEAMQAAYKLLADLDRELLDEVHASRAARRERCAECREPIAPGKAHWKINEGPCMILPADQIDPDTAEATYPMEPTA